MVEAPTAYTLLHGGYDAMVRLYENGGLFLRGNIGFHERFVFGFSGNATNVIGHGTIQVQEPRLGVKFKMLKQGALPISLALGWDDRGYGTVSGHRFSPGLQKGLYAVVSREFPKAGYLQLHGGANAVRFNDFDADRDLGAFAGTSFALSRALVLNAEFDKLLTDFWQFNANFHFAFEDSLHLGLDFRDINDRNRFARILRMQYLSFF